MTHRAAEDQARKDRDVAAGDGDDVIGPGFLEPLLDVGIEPAAIADEDRHRHCRRLRVEHADMPVDGVSDSARIAAAARRSSRPLSIDLDQRGALDGPDERDATPRHQPFEIGDAVIQILGRPPRWRSRGRCRPDAPFADLIGANAPATVNDTPPAVSHARAQPKPARPHSQRRAGLAEGRIRREPALNFDRRLMTHRVEAVDCRTRRACLRDTSKRGSHGACLRVGRNQHAGGRESENDERPREGSQPAGSGEEGTEGERRPASPPALSQTGSRKTPAAEPAAVAIARPAGK